MLGIEALSSRLLSPESEIFQDIAKDISLQKG